MLQNGNSVQSLWLGGERFDKYSQDDEDALAKYKKLQSFIGTTVHVSTNDKITDININLAGNALDDITPEYDADVTVTNIMWDGDSSVDLIGSVDVKYDIDEKTPLYSTDQCIIGYKSI